MPTSISINNGAVSVDNYNIRYTAGSITVTPKALTRQMVTDDGPTFTYTGDMIGPEITLEDLDKPCEITRSDYIITGDRQVNSVNYTYNVIGIGNYTGVVNVD